MNPKVTVVVTAYNLESYLKQCLDSVKRQKLNDFECIVIDDGSTDSTVKIANGFADKDSRFSVISKKNGGVSSARNLGFKLATSEYIVFIDGDDFIDAKFLYHLYRRAEASNSNVVFSNFKLYYQSMNKYSDLQINFTEFKADTISYTGNPNDILSLPTLMVWNKLIKRSFLEENELYSDESLRRAQDIDFIGRVLLSAGDVDIADEALIFYRTDAPSSNVKNLYLHHLDVLKALNNLGEYIKQKDYLESRYSYAKVAINHILASLYFTETFVVHKEVYQESKEFLLNIKDDIDHIMVDLDSKTRNELNILMSTDYESWLQSRISDLRDDSQAKYISYLLGEFQRKYDEESKKYEYEHNLRVSIEQSVSWRLTKGIRGIQKLKHRLKYGKKK